MNATITRATKRTLGRCSVCVLYFSMMLMITPDGHTRFTCTRFLFPRAKIQIENPQSEVESTLALKRGTNIVRNPKTEVPEASLKGHHPKLNKIFRR